MFRNKFIVICLLVAGGSSLLSAQVLPNVPRDTLKDTIPAEGIVIPSTTTTTTTQSPITTTTSTPAPTTAKPTHAPTTPTTTTTTSTTTPTPKTTTVGPVTTPAPNPVPIPDPPMGRWNTSCILLQMATQLNFTYETADNKTASVVYNVPAPDTKINDVSCDSNNTQQIVLSWGPATGVHMMTVYFERNDTNINVHQIVVTLPIDAPEFFNPKPKQTVQLVYRGDIFEAPSHMSYHCTRPQTFNMTETINNKTIVGTIRFSDVQMEAFRQDNSTTFSSARDCDSSETPDIVPIAVGIALVALILIVLVSYLCARRRSTARGYMSF